MKFMQGKKHGSTSSTSVKGGDSLNCKQSDWTPVATGLPSSAESTLHPKCNLRLFVQKKKKVFSHVIDFLQRRYSPERQLSKSTASKMSEKF
ncbi:hypothetical protein CDAR_561111 [Caerostris darwini]|uniref:Uncharacterized protein n=1 Tax=Caerostris darwini TaxID=1538125 RepID=A0AAV4TBY8_9ARAC|nr:hypothetical protein CDAR_561111 [Caerostris darwini]